MVNFISTLLLIISLSSLSLAQSDDTIHWSTRKLKIEDFQGKSDAINLKNIDGYSMLTSPIRWVGKKDTIYVVVSNCFIKKESFFIKNETQSMNDKFLLNHEQGHFDIQEVELRKFKKQLLGTPYASYAQFKEVYRKLMDSYLTNKTTTQKQYDAETDLSKNKQKQKEWDTKIAKELKSLDLYSSHIIKIPIIKTGK